MSEIKLTVSRSLASGPVTVELVDSSSRVIGRHAVTPGAPTNVTVRPGLYMARVFLPDGEMVMQQCNLEGESDSAPLRLARAAPEVLRTVSGIEIFGGAVLSKGVLEAFGTGGAGHSLPTPAEVGESDEAGATDESEEAASQAGLGFVISDVESAAPLELDFLAAGSPLDAELLAWRNALRVAAPRAAGGLFLRLPDLPPGRRAPLLRIAGPGIDARLLMLPGDCVAIGVSLERGERTDRAGVPQLRVVVRTRSPQAESLLGLLTAGQFAGATDLAKDLLYEKVDNPWAAAIGAYVLMRGGQLGRLRSWIERLDIDFPWLPDGTLLHAWTLLRLENESAFDHSCALFLAAHQRGTPVYSQGLRLLLDGLKLACQRRPDDDALAAALARVQEVASCAIWRSPLTCCYGAEPSQPQRGLRYQGVAAVTVNLGST